MPLYLEKVGGRFKENETFCQFSWTIGHAKMMKFGKSETYENDEIIRRDLPLYLEKVGGRFKENETFCQFSWTIGHAKMMKFGKSEIS